ncbi:hypothetical protein D3C75_962700 [compost metagenome]
MIGGIDQLVLHPHKEQHGKCIGNHRRHYTGQDNIGEGQLKLGFKRSFVHTAAPCLRICPFVADSPYSRDIIAGRIGSGQLGADFLDMLHHGGGIPFGIITPHLLINMLARKNLPAMQRQQLGNLIFPPG